MELTVNIPVDEWYRDTVNNDLDYWGLDYPPLTAYLSALHGHLSADVCVPACARARARSLVRSTRLSVARSARWVDAKSMALYASRGYDTPLFKFFMRVTVLSSDVLLLFPALVAFVHTMAPQLSALRKVARAPVRRLSGRRDARFFLIFFFFWVRIGGSGR